MDRAPLGFAELEQALSDQLDALRPAFGEIRGLGPLGGPAMVADATTKAAVLGRDGSPVAVIICSSPQAPVLVARGTANAATAKQRLGPDLGSVIMDPLGAGKVQGLAFVILPYRRPLASHKLAWLMQRSSIMPRVIDWLHRVAEVPTAPDAGRDGFAPALVHCAEHPKLSAEIRRDASAALERLARGNWHPRHTLDHNDMWKDNILRAAPVRDGQSSAWPFTLIDWVGANVLGFGMYDLVRLGRSMGLSSGSLEREVVRHCRALGCERVDAMGHLLASLGWLGMNLEHFPVDRYVRAVESCWQTVKGGTR